jgi:hypothetical protein
MPQRGAVGQVSTQDPVFDEWVDLVVELVRGTPGFPRAVVADHLAETFECHVSWNWAEPDGSFGCELDLTRRRQPLLCELARSVTGCWCPRRTMHTHWRTSTASSASPTA